VRPPRRTFCSDPCVHEWRLRSDPSYARAEVWKRDRGTCRACGLKLAAALRRWRRERPAARRGASYREWRRRRPRWEADHILPVADGGGECGLENYRLLCRACHLQVTSTWRRGRRARRLEDDAAA
jgi:5-methylcytosine-specific restriction endonuclease McrA